MKILLAAIFCTLLLTGIPTWERAAAATDTAVEVSVGIPPVAYLVGRVGGERVAVTTLLPVGRDPHSFEPSPGLVGELARARLYFSLDMPFERMLLNRLAGSGPRVVEVGRGIKRLPMPADHHHHGEEVSNHHHEGELDPHVWLSPRALTIIAAHTMTALAEFDPPHAAYYLDNYLELKGEIEALHHRLQELLAPLAGRSFYVYHPAFGYFADTYGLIQRGVEIGGKSPTPRQLINLIHHARHNRVRVIFVQPQFDPKSAAAVARAIDGVVAPLDPLAENVLANLEEMAHQVHRALASEPAAAADPGTPTEPDGQSGPGGAAESPFSAPAPTRNQP